MHRVKTFVCELVIAPDIWGKTIGAPFVIWFYPNNYVRVRLFFQSYSSVYSDGKCDMHKNGHTRIMAVETCS